MDYEDRCTKTAPTKGESTPHTIKMALLLILIHTSLSFLLFLTMASGFIIQWNYRGLSANRQELELLAQEYKAPVICLQETNLND